MWFLRDCELPAMQKWNPFDINTPAPQRPRIGHHSVLNDTNYGTGMYFWTAMMPLRARKYFTRRERELGDTLAEYPRYFLQYNPRPQGNDQPPMQDRPDLGEAPVPAQGDDEPVPEPEEPEHNNDVEGEPLQGFREPEEIEMRDL